MLSRFPCAFSSSVDHHPHCECKWTHQIQCFPRVVPDTLKSLCGVSRKPDACGGLSLYSFLGKQQHSFHFAPLYSSNLPMFGFWLGCKHQGQCFSTTWPKKVTFSTIVQRDRFAHLALPGLQSHILVHSEHSCLPFKWLCRAISAVLKVPYRPHLWYCRGRMGASVTLVIHIYRIMVEQLRGRGVESPQRGKMCVCLSESNIVSTAPELKTEFVYFSN